MGQAVEYALDLSSDGTVKMKYYYQAAINVCLQNLFFTFPDLAGVSQILSG
jgi:hypothetical protein